ncbi:hypothetical protein [Actinocrispum wychmicini]|uniref:Uncharacterized protein n=1 Tax=Actinocrispum wychmicini TaxID=1213861 RepID=A0A4R2JNF3_9PSEU|nr:hypothetical protein [Actinocrispum wychmicini]TCO60854.1 hypothetical protein EV192_103435 [Actinocrispum wychmicini]
MTTTAPRLLSATPVDLGGHFDNRGITRGGELDQGGFNIWDNTFPAEDLPEPGGTVRIGDVPFLFPAPDPAGRDNLRCSGQVIELPTGRYDWLYLLAASERRSEDVITLHHADGSVDPQWLRVSDFWAETPAHFGEQASVRCRSLHYPRHIQRNMAPVIWRTRVPVPRETDLAAIGLPDNVAIHIFALTLIGPEA